MSETGKPDVHFEGLTWLHAMAKIQPDLLKQWVEDFNKDWQAVKEDQLDRVQSQINNIIRIEQDGK